MLQKSAIITGFLSALLLSGCGVRSSHVPPPVSKRIEEGTGHGLRPTGQPEGLAIPDGVSLADGLSEDEAVAVALWNNAAFQTDLTGLGFARADLIEAGLLRNPIFTLLFPLGPKQMEAYVNWPLEALWQRPRRVALAELEYDRVAEGLVLNGLNLVRDVRIAYTDLVSAKEIARIGAEVARERREIARITDSRLRAGDISGLEASSSRIDAHLAEEQASQLERDTTLAGDRLRALLGLVGEEPALEVPPPALAATPDMAVDKSDAVDLTASQLLTAALAARPELRAAELAIEAAGQRAKWERSKILTLAGMIDMNGEGKKGFEIGPGIQAEIPLFNPNKGGRGRADAEVERAAKHFIAVRHRIILEVQEAHTQCLQARQALVSWQTRIIPAVEEDVRGAGKAYAAGDVAYLFVLEATRRRTDARMREAEARAALRRASARLDRSIGRRISAKP